MVSILHISDFHLTQNPDGHNLQNAILDYAKKHLRDTDTQDGKLLIITGDFHNYKQGYEPTKKFLNELITAMGIDPEQDVFVVPGNHDVSGDDSCDFLIELLNKDEDSRKKLNQAGDLRNKEMGELLSRRYDDYLKFVREMNIYSSSSEKFLPVRVHVRTWRNQLHILHLNTTLIADGNTKINQMADALTATSPEIKTALRRDNLPCIAIGHNNFLDLDQTLQNQLKGSFLHANITAYLCGDRHQKAKTRDERSITLQDAPPVLLYNIGTLRGSADPMDNFSDFGMLLHQWDKQTGKVNYTVLSWEKDYQGHIQHKGLGEYAFRDYQPPKSAPESVSKPAPIVDTPPVNMGNVSAPAATSAPTTVPIPATTSTPSTVPAPDTTPKSTSESVSKPAPSVDTPPEENKLSPQEQFLADMEALFKEYGSYPSIQRVYYVGRNLMKTLKDSNISLSDKSHSMMDCQNLLHATIKDMENDFEDLSPNKYDRIKKLEKTLVDLKKI